jgi:hypothetical protein
MIAGLYYFDLGLLECNETKLRKAKTVKPKGISGFSWM